jgi:hypothetical protein
MWSYYGAKTNIIDYYPVPKHNKIIEPIKKDIIINSIPNEIEEDIYNKKIWIIQSKMNFKFMSKPEWFLDTIRQGTIFPIRLIPEEKFNDIWDLIESDDRIEVKDGLLIGLNKNQATEVRKKRRTE